MTIEAEVAIITPPLVRRRHWVRSARLAFRNWRRSRPFWAGVWAMFGGALIAYVPATAFKFFLIANSSLIIGVLVGALVGFFGLMLWFARAIRVPLGVMIILLSLASFFTSDFGGLILGLLMGLIGGSLAISWVPTKVTRRERRRAAAIVAGAPDLETIGAPEHIAATEPEHDPGSDIPELTDDILGSDVEEALVPATVGADDHADDDQADDDHPHDPPAGRPEPQPRHRISGVRHPAPHKVLPRSS